MVPHLTDRQGSRGLLPNGTSKGFVVGKMADLLRKCGFYAAFVRESGWIVLKFSLATCEASPCHITRLFLPSSGGDA